MIDIREEILDHYKHPRNYGEMENATHQNKEGNASCGDIVEFFLRVKDGVIEEVAWKGEGCAVSTASASMLSEKIKGRTLAEVRGWKEELVFEFVGEVNPGRIKCALLPLLAVKQVKENTA